MPESFCEQHSGCVQSIRTLERDVEELKKYIHDMATKEELESLKAYFDKQIDELKEESEKHFSNTRELKEALIRLEETTKTLKQSIEKMSTDNKEQIDKMIDRMDKMYDLILNFKPPQGDTKTEKKEEDDKDVPHNSLDFTSKPVIFVILLLVAVIVFLITGKWVLPLGN